MSEPLLSIENLAVSFQTEWGSARAVDGVSFEIPEGASVGLVGESGCGKSVTAMSTVGLLPKPQGRVVNGEVYLHGEDLLQASERRMSEVRGGEVGVIFQEPMSALNPVQRVGKQLMESLALHRNLTGREAMAEVVRWFRKVGIPEPEKRAMQYPHQLSGGMRQRVMIAVALCNNPKLVIADEPTTALDVTVQAQILELLQEMREELKMSLLLITHDMGVIAQNCEVVVVMYAGRVVERAPVLELFARPAHAYTKGLLASIPRLDAKRKSRMETIPGQVASIRDFVLGCRFCQRVNKKGAALKEKPPFVEISPGHWVEACEDCFVG